MAVAEWSGTLVNWKAELEGLKWFVAPALGRAETRAAGGVFIDGLLSSADVLRDLVRGYVAKALGDPGGDLVIGEAGFLKKGTHSVGVGQWVYPQVVAA